MKAFVGAADNLGHSPTGKGDPAVVFMLTSDGIALRYFGKTAWEIVPRCTGGRQITQEVIAIVQAKNDRSLN